MLFLCWPFSLLVMIYINKLETFMFYVFWILQLRFGKRSACCWTSWVILISGHVVHPGKNRKISCFSSLGYVSRTVTSLLCKAESKNMFINSALNYFHHVELCVPILHFAFLFEQKFYTALQVSTEHSSGQTYSLLVAILFISWQLVFLWSNELIYFSFWTAINTYGGMKVR